MKAIKAERHGQARSSAVVWKLSEYDQVPQQEKLLIPAHYEKFVSKSNQLPDPIALELIRKICHYRPKEISIPVKTFKQLKNALQEREFLTEFFFLKK